MSQPGDSRQQKYIYREPSAADAVVPGTESGTGRSTNPARVIEQLLQAGDRTDPGALDPRVLQQLQAVADKLGHLDFCSNPVCEEMVAAVLISDAEHRRGAIPDGVIRMVAATLSQDVTAQARLSALWDKLRRKVA